MGDYLAELLDSPLAADPHSDTGAVIHNLKRDYDKKTKLPQSLVEELARTAVLGPAGVGRGPEGERLRAVPAAAGKDDRSQAAAGRGARLRRRAVRRRCWTTSSRAKRRPNVRRVLAELREQLVPLVAAIVESRRRPNLEVMRRRYPIDVQEKFGQQAAAAIGFDFKPAGST